MHYQQHNRFKRILYITVLMTVFIIPFSFFITHPKQLTHLVALYVLPVVFCVIFYLSPRPLPTIEKTRTKVHKYKFSQKVKHLGVIGATEVFILLLCLSMVMLLAVIEQTTYQANLHLKLNLNKQFIYSQLLPWCGFWSYFAIYTSASYFYYYRTQQQAPLISCAVYQPRNAYTNLLIKRALNVFQLGTNLFFIYLAMTCLVFNCLNYLAPKLVVGIYPYNFLAFFAIAFIGNLFNFPGLRKLISKVLPKGLDCLAIAVIIVLLTLWFFNSLNQQAISTPSNHSNLAQFFVMLRNQATQQQTNSVIHLTLFFYALLVLATPLFSSIIIKYCPGYSIKQLLTKILICAIILSLLFLAGLSTLQLYWTFINNIALLLSIAFISFFFRQKDTQGFLLGVLTLAKQQRITLFRENSALLYTHIVAIGCISLTVFCFRLSVLQVLVIVTAAVMLLISLGNLTALFGYLRRLKKLL